MLELRPNCECCDCDLPPESLEARICSFECTFCASCADVKLGGKCPNCGGELVIRPRRPPAALATSPASTRRVFKPQGCNVIRGAALALLAVCLGPSLVKGAVLPPEDVAVAPGPGPYDFDCNSRGQQIVQFLAAAPAARVSIRGYFHFEKTYFGTEWAPLASIGLRNADSSLEVTLQGEVNGEYTRVEIYTSVPKLSDSRKLLVMTPLTYRYIPFSITMNADGTVSESVGTDALTLSAASFSASSVQLACLTAHVKFRDVTVSAAQ